jgi:hypothetical protein
MSAKCMTFRRREDKIFSDSRSVGGDGCSGHAIKAEGGLNNEYNSYRVYEIGCKTRVAPRRVLAAPITSQSEDSLCQL